MKLLDEILDFLFPPVCVCCKRALSTKTEIPFCKECFALLENCEVKENKDIKDTNVSKCYCLYRYNEYDVKGIVFHTKNYYSKRFAFYIAEKTKNKLAEHNILNQIDVITFCPRKKANIKKFGFDQAEEMAKYLSLATSIPYNKCIFRKGRAKDQKFLNSAERKENVKNVYFFNSGIDVSEKVILLVDDVVTTGSTVKACAKLLKENGAKAVYVLSIAD